MGKSPEPVAQVLEGTLEVQAEGIVDLRGDTRDAERLFQRIARPSSNRELVIDVVELGGRNCGIGYVACERLLIEEFAIAIRAILTSRFPPSRWRSFTRRMAACNGIEAAVGSLNIVKIFLLAAMNAEHPQAFGHLRIVRGNQTAVARCAQVLRGKETEAAKIANRAGKLIVVASADGLRGVFDDQQFVGSRNFENGIEVRRKAEKMDWHNRASSRGDSGGDLWRDRY